MQSDERLGLSPGEKEFTTDNLNKAYEALKTDGLLELKEHKQTVSRK